MITFIFAVGFCLSAGATVGHFKLDHRISLSGGEGWDCLAVDPSSDRLFVTRGNHVDVVDLQTEKVVGTIADNIDGAHALAFVPALNKGYVTSGKTEKVVVFDLKTLKPIKQIPAGKKPDLILFDEYTKRIFSFNGGDGSVTIIDVNKDEVVKTLVIGGKPEFAVSDQKGQIFLNDEEKSQILVIDSKKMELKTSWPLKGCEAPTGLVADFSQRRLFSVCDNEVMAVVDADSGKVLKTLPIGKGPDGAGIDGKFVFSSNGSGTLTVVERMDKKNWNVAENVNTQKGARTMAISEKTHMIYLPAAKYEPVDPSNPKLRPKIISGTVEILVVKK